MTPKDTIVVGVDGTRGGLAAARWAAGAAQREDRTLTLVHVVPTTVPVSSLGPLVPDDEVRTLGWRSLEQARHAVRDVSGDTVQTTSHLVAGGRVGGLLKHAEAAATIVLGDRTRTVLAVPTGSVITGVAARAHCPVLVVPELLPDKDVDAPVVVGVDDPLHSGELLEEAARVAASTRRPLLVMHAWKLPAPYADLVVSHAEQDGWREHLRSRIGQALDTLGISASEMAVDVEIRHDRAADALTTASHDAYELLVGRRGAGGRRGFHLGAVARAVMAHAACPVRVVPLRVRAKEPHWVHFSEAEATPST